MRTLPIINDLPGPILAGIGRVIILWAHQEHLLRTIIYSLLNLSPKQGRIAVRSPRVEDVITMIKHLILVEDIKVDGFDFQGFTIELKRLEKWRDKLSHGIWAFHPETKKYVVQDTAGIWKPSPHKPKVSKRISPEGIAVTEDQLSKLIKAISLTISETSILYFQIETIRQTSPQKSK